MGEGIRIGHPDSGFRTHEQLDAARILTNLDFDFLKDDDVALTDGESGEFNSGNHGLGTASVIISGEAQLAAKPYVTGIAPRAELVPLRVTRPHGIIPAPVLFEVGMRYLRKAINYAVDQGCHVISISLGGPVPFDLHEAIQRATSEGVIVLAAAGNVVRFVVWPALFDEVIAVAACNIERKPWLHSSLGSAVDITAPGESVWKAVINSQNQPDVDRASGTSFAVATVAGVAALWLAYHGRDKLIAKYGKPGHRASLYGHPETDG